MPHLAPVFLPLDSVRRMVVLVLVLLTRNLQIFFTTEVSNEETCLLFYLFSTGGLRDASRNLKTYFVREIAYAMHLVDGYKAICLKGQGTRVGDHRGRPGFCRCKQ